MKCIAWYDYGLFLAVSLANLWLVGESVYRMRAYKPFCRICQADIDETEGQEEHS